MTRYKKTKDEKERQPFATRIRTLIDADPQITQADVAAAIGKSRQVVSQYCHGDSEPAYDTLVKIAAFFGVTVDYLLGVTETKSTRPDLQAAVQLSGISEENMVFLESCTRLPNKTDNLRLTNDLITMVRCDEEVLTSFRNLIICGEDYSEAPPLCELFTKMAALEVGRAVEKNLIDKYIGSGNPAR